MKSQLRSIIMIDKHLAAACRWFSGLCQTSKMKLFVKEVSDFRKSSILDA